jgi:hypothetical protein
MKKTQIKEGKVAERLWPSIAVSLLILWRGSLPPKDPLFLGNPLILAQTGFLMKQFC